MFHVILYKTKSEYPNDKRYFNLLQKDRKIKLYNLSFPIFYTAYIIVPKGLAAFGSIDIFHKKRLES